MSDLENAAYDAKCAPASPGASDATPGESGGTITPITAVPSPCIDVCKIDGDTGLCIGCLRTRDEIRGWKNMTDDLRRQMISELAQRKAKPEAGTVEAP